MTKVVLIGYMGSGKSVLSQKLSEKSKIPFLELDEIIEQKCNLTIEKIFETKGELFFRKIESELFTNFLLNDEDLIISTGGGTPCYFNNHELLKNKNVISIYLKASITTLKNRLIKEKLRRPLISNLEDNEVEEFIAKHLFERSYYYNQATFKVAVDTKSIEEIVQEILVLLA
ncbi:shikimate kinase [Flavobacterium sp. SUN052]|uniref:shikimate kinase n=1 Tax=Flavobacterium sp. SUN052 TaxID=3002441 RepID=UPI00237D71B0|nr:shikimate kinase [Flavobacterium sp. SUN052]MEC4005277.1 shikimate kinase [Flavobacterium sp. SUN052]